MLSTSDANSLHIPGYKVEREIGRGGFASVYQAVQESLHRYVALKVMNPVMASDKSLQQRFRNEARIMARLRHPNIVVVHDIGIHDEYFYFSMDYLPGGTLKERLYQSLPSDVAVSIAIKVAQALAHAHQLDIIHRDIKPGNVLFDSNDTPVLTDFGIAKILTDHDITGTGMMLGSGGYMSPEQIQGKAVDRRTDLYAFGVLLWQMLTGEMPFVADDAFALALKHANEPIPTLPPQHSVFQPIMNRLLAKAADDRYESTEQVIAELEKLSTPTLSTSSITTSISDDTRMVPAPISSASENKSIAKPKPKPKPAKKKSAFVPGLMTGFLVAAVAAGGLFYFDALNLPEPASEATTENGDASKIVFSQQQTDALSDQLAQVKKARDQVGQEHSEQLAQAQQEQAELLKQIEAEQQALKKTRSIQQATLNDEKRALEQLRQQLQTLKNPSDDAQIGKQLLALTQQKESLQLAIKEQRSQTQQQQTRANDQLASERDEIATLQTDLAELQKQASLQQTNQQDAVAQLQADKNQLQQQIDAQQQQLKQNQSSNDEQLNTQTDELAQLKSQLQALSEQQQQNDQQYSQQLKTLNNEKSALLNDIETLQSQSNAEQISQAKSLAQEKETLNQLRQELNQLLAQANKPDNSTETVLSQLQAEQTKIKQLVLAQQTSNAQNRSKLQQSIKNEEQALKQLQEQLRIVRQTTQTTLHNTQQSLAQLQNQRVAVEQQLTKAGHDSSKLNNLRQRIAALAIELEAQSTASLASAQDDVTNKHDALISRLLATADEHIRNGRLTKPQSGNALATCRTLRQIAPGQVDACLNNIADRYAQWVRDALAAQNWGLAAEQIKKGLSVQPNHTELRNLITVLQVLQNKQ